MKIDGKSLLHLGGALFQLPALKKAKELGCRVILVDQNENAPGRVYADVFERVSTRDYEGILKVAKQYNIDGIMTYASDSSPHTVTLVAEALRLPGNPPKAAELLQRKDLFREFQRSHGLPHPNFFVTGDQNEAEKRAEEIRFPMVFKPVDSSGTRGQSIVYSASEVAEAFNRAIDASKCRKVICEAFIKADIEELDGDVLVKEGQLAFRHYGHNHFLKDRISNVPSGEIFPGLYGHEVAGQLDEQFRTIIRELGLNIGTMNFDGIQSEGISYIVDIALRSGGNYVPDAIEYSTGFDMTSAAIYAALGEDYPCEKLSVPDAVPVVSYLVGSRFPGKLREVGFSEIINEYFIEYRPFFNVGDRVSHYVRSDLAVGIAFFKFPDMETMRLILDQIEDLIDLKVDPNKGDDELTFDGRSDDFQVDPNAYKSFRELLSPFLRTKVAEAEANDDQTVLRVLRGQYIFSEKENAIRMKEGLRHYDASADAYHEGEKMAGIERIYRRVILFEPLYQCIAHCRYCLRRNYEPFNQNRESIERIARFVGGGEGHEDLREVLITGGDPFLAPGKVKIFLESLAEYAPQIKIVRIATRVPIHQPDRVNDKLLDILGAKHPFRIEVATQINHAAEMFPEVIEAYHRVLDVVRVVYNQTVLLKGVNDSKRELVELFDMLRDVGIENHYIFHCVAIGGLDHLRTPVMNSIDLVRAASTTGQVAGRAKPKLCFMTSIGKIIPYHGTIIGSKNNRILFKSEYLLEDRLKWNPHWRLPADAEVTDDGYLSVWYEDSSGSMEELSDNIAQPVEMVGN